MEYVSEDENEII